MLKSWMAAISLSLAVAGTQTICGSIASPHKVDCQSPLDVFSSLKPIDKAVVVNKSEQCAVVY